MRTVEERRYVLNRMPGRGLTVGKVFRRAAWFCRTVGHDEFGQGLVEYSLILAFAVVVVIAALTIMGSDLAADLSHIATSL